ncbi:DUF6230 family protein [Lentzea sp. NPDC059081]|uniref:DUF6230 family protein n=1 Tax=Lentzea sp. NPDC059081 TaxID=3346719 RepID=UPI0036755101
MGRTRWARFVGVFGIGTVGVGALLFGMSQGALAASFAVSGTNFKVSSDSLTGQGFVQFGGVDAGAGQVHVVAVSGFKTATLDKFCQSVFVANMPIVGDITLRITADGAGGMSADNLVVNLTDLSGDLTLGNPEIGVDANKVNKGPENLRGLPGSFGLQADSANITGLKQTAWSTTAQTIRFKNMNLTIRQGKQECF